MKYNAINIIMGNIFQHLKKAVMHFLARWKNHSKVNYKKKLCKFGDRAKSKTKIDFHAFYNVTSLKKTFLHKSESCTRLDSRLDGFF